MKKQLFILFLALFTSFSVFAQYDPPVNCGANTPENPSVGLLYNYEVSVQSIAGFDGTGTYDWFITQDVNLLTGTHFPNDGSTFTASGYYDNDANTNDNIGITWNTFNANPYFLVVRHTATATDATCPTENIKVYKIEPVNTFWVGILAAGADICAANVSQALINATFDQVEYLYGVNTFTTKIMAGGYNGTWDAQLQIGNLADDQTLTIAWQGATTNGTFTVPTGGTTGATLNGIWTAADLPSVFAGEEITLTFTLTNNHYETLADQVINIAIDGSYDSNGTTVDDINSDCTLETAFADATTQTIDARPTVNPISPPAFIPQVTP